MKIACISQIDQMAATQGLGQRTGNYPENVPLAYSVVVYDNPADVAIYQTQRRDTMLQAVKEAAKAGKQFHVYRRPLQAAGRA